MDMALDAGSAAAPWSLTAADLDLVASKSRANRLSFAVMLAFCRGMGRFPRVSEAPDPIAVAHLARSVGSDGSDAGDMTDRTVKRHRAEIRSLLGLREATVADGDALVAWLADNAVARTRLAARLAADLEQRCRSLSIEPPTLDRIERIVRAAVRAYEDRLHVAIRDRLPVDARARLDALLLPAGPASDAPDVEPDDARRAAPLIFLRGDPGRASVNSLREELARLNAIRAIGLPADLFSRWSPQEMEACRQRVAVEAPYELRRHSDVTRLAWLAAYVHLRGRAITDTLVDLLIETVHHIGARAEHRVEQELLDDLKRVSGEQNLLFELADAAIENPDGVVRQVLFPVVGEQTLRDLVREWKATGPTYRTTLRTTIRNSYRGHYRQAVLELLAALDFRSNNEAHRPVIRAVDLVRRFAASRAHSFRR